MKHFKRCRNVIYNNQICVKITSSFQTELASNNPPLIFQPNASALSCTWILLERFGGNVQQQQQLTKYESQFSTFLGVNLRDTLQMFKYQGLSELSLCLLKEDISNCWDKIAQSMEWWSQENNTEKITSSPHSVEGMNADVESIES